MLHIRQRQVWHEEIDYPMADSTRKRILRCFSAQLQITNFTITYINYICMQVQNMATSPPPIIAFNMVSIILEFLQLKYQGKDKTPFETHPKTMSLAITCCLGYYWACNTDMKLYAFQRWTTFTSIFVCCKVLLGNLSMAFTASVLLPDSVRPALLVFCMLLSATELSVELVWLYQRSMRRVREWIAQRRRSTRQLLNLVGRRTCYPILKPRHVLPLWLEET